jgi:hypothetical protein
MLISAGTRDMSHIFFQMGNNPITTAGCVSIATAINESDVSVLETLDLHVSLRINNY